MIPVPEPDLTPRELIRRAAAFKPRLRAEQDEADARGTYSEVLHREFVRAGFYRCCQPRMFGGYEFDLVTFYRVMLEISSGHPGTGWGLALAASHAFEIASHWPERAQAELFGEGHFVAPHRAPPLGTLTPVEGGFLVNGTWDYCSGVPHSTHLVVGGMTRRAGEPPKVGHAVLPRGSYEILDDWGGERVMGMCASGSNSVRIKDAFVPEHHVGFLSPGLASTPESMADGTPGTRLHGNPMYLGRLAGPFHATLVVPVLGAARAALDEYEELIRARRTLSVPVTKRYEHFDFQRPFGQALTLADAAEAVMIRGLEMYAEYCARWAAEGTPITVEENMRLWGMIQHAGRLACDAVELLFQTAGSAAAKKGGRLLRYFNDVQMYRGHSSSQVLNFASGLARLRFGLPWGLWGL